MKYTNIDLSSVVAVGKVEAQVSDGILKMRTLRAIHDVGYNIRRDRISSYFAVPGLFRAPMRIDLCIHIDMPVLLLLVGDGHVSFGSPWMENRSIEDIAEPCGKPRKYYNQVPLGEFVELSVIYGVKQMQILVGGELRYCSTKERYMKSECFAAQNDEGFPVGIACTKRADLRIRSICITEYDDAAPPALHRAVQEVVPVSVPSQVQKPTFDSCIEGLIPEIRAEIKKTDGFLKSLDILKFKRTINKNGTKITYVESNQGVSYAIYLSGSLMHHSVQWYIITNSKPELWHRKANPLEELLTEIRKKSPELAARIFFNLNECIGCREHCLAKTPYSYQSQKKLTCHGHIFFKMCLSDFQDVRDLFSEMNQFSANRQ